MKLATFSSMMLLSVSAEECGNPDAIVQGVKVWTDAKCTVEKKDVTETDIENNKKLFNAYMANYINKCGQAIDPDTGKPISGAYGKVTCPTADGTKAEMFTDADCKTECNTGDCQVVEAKLTYKWGSCIQWHDGSYLTMTGASLMAASISASLVAVASALF